MDQERWKKIKPILEDALAAGTAGRTAFLVEACGGDAELLDEVREMLDLEVPEADPLERSAHSYLFSANGRSQPGEQIDKYKIISELGAGGMGAVFLAERVDGTYTQQVALKVIKEGIDSDEILARFFKERQILATLQHDNIARLIDGGTTDAGRPFLAMEYVEGTPITDFAADSDLDARLMLFAEVCSAVSFAHKNLIIHRDLKPSNILVTKDGVPKLLDFGIAKLLPTESGEAVTATQRFVFTPEYASPEQVRGEKLTTATDIYSLGVILYELLAERRPYRTDGSNISQIIHVVCESEPTAPSRALTHVSSGEQPTKLKTREFAPQLKGDLDNIVLKALRKEPERRYASVDQFSDDIHRYLAGQPVSATADTWRYRTGKLIRRNRIAVAGALLVLISMIVGLGATIYQARIASSERAKAEKRFNDVRRLANSFVFEINDEIDKSPIKARALLVQRAIEYLDSLSSEASGDDALTSELGAAYEKIGDIQTEIFQANLGNAQGALESHNKALALRFQLYEKDTNDIQRGVDVAKSRQKVGNLLTVTGDIKGAEQSYRAAVEVSEKIAALNGDEVDDPSVRKQIGNSYVTLGQAILRSGSLSESLRNYEKAFEVNRQLVLDYPTNIEIIRRQAITFSYIGYVRMLMGNYDRAVADYEKALIIEKSLLDTDPANLRFQRNASVAYLWVGIGYRESGRLPESLANMQKALDLEQALLNADKQNFGEQNSIADCWLELAMLAARSSKYAEAINAYHKAINNYSSVAANDKNNLSALAQIQLARRLLADVLGKQGKNSAALKKYRESLSVMTDLAGRDPGNLEWKYAVAECRLGIGRSLRGIDDKAGAVESYRAAMPDFESLAAVSPENIKYKDALDEIKNNLAALAPN